MGLVTAEVVYVRLHEHTRSYSSTYAAPSLKRWALRVRRWHESAHTVCIYFDNTPAGGAAVRSARQVWQLLRSDAAVAGGQACEGAFGVDAT